MKCVDVEIKDLLIDGHCVLHAHDELNVGRSRQLAFLRHLMRLKDMRQIKGLYLGFDAIGDHLGGKPIHQIRRIFIDAGGKIVGPN